MAGDWEQYRKERKAWSEILFGPGVDQNGITELHDELRAIQRSTALDPLAAVSGKLWREGQMVGKHGGQLATDWLCAFIAQEVLRVSSDLGPNLLSKATSLARALRLAYSIEDYFQIKKREGLTGQAILDAERSFFFRTADEQFGPQSKRWHLIPRFRSLFETIPSQLKRQIPICRLNFSSNSACRYPISWPSASPSLAGFRLALAPASPQIRC